MPRFCDADIWTKGGESLMLPLGTGPLDGLWTSSLGGTGSFNTGAHAAGLWSSHTDTTWV